jgi:hypothetical protein
MKKLIISFILIMATVGVFAKTYKYGSIDSKNLQNDAIAYLHTKNPTLTQHDLELLYGYVAVRLYNAERGINTVFTAD